MQIRTILYQYIKTLIKHVFLLNFTYELLMSFRSNMQTAEFGLYQMYKHSASPRVYKSDKNLLRGLYILHIKLKLLTSDFLQSVQD